MTTEHVDRVEKLEPKERFTRTSENKSLHLQVKSAKSEVKYMFTVDHMYIECH